MDKGFIVAVDFEPKFGLSKLFSLASTYSKGVKIGLPFLLEKGGAIRQYLEELPGLLKIADLKLADIGFVMSRAVEVLKNLGFNAVIAHAFVGVEGALGELSDRVKEAGMKLFVVVAMSHPGAEEVLNKRFGDLLGVAKKVRASGVIAPATMPEYIRRARESLGNGVLIASPGVGTQGAKPGTAIANGANYEIIGRLITSSEDPESVMRRLSSIYE